MSSVAASAAARTARYAGTLRILTVNDIYSPGPVDGVGGWACLSTLLREYRTPNSILCINGDFLGGSALAEHHQGRNVVAMIDALRTDVVVIGNHEFDYGSDGLKARMRETNKACTWLGSNVRERTAEAAAAAAAAEADGDDASSANVPAEEGALFEGVTDLMQVQLQLQRVADESDPQATSSASFPATAPVRMGLFGVCTPHTPQLSWPGPLVSFAPVLPVVERCVAQLKGHTQQAPTDVPVLHLPRPVAPASSAEPSSDDDTGAATDAAAPSRSDPFAPSDGIIAVTHLSNAEDRKIARTHGKHINVVMGGHDHDAVALMEGNTLLFKAGQNAFWLGVIDLKLELVLTEKNNFAASPSPSALAMPTPSAGIAASSAAPSMTPPPQLLSPAPASVAGQVAASSPFHRSVSIYPSWSMVHNRGFEPDPSIARIVAKYTAAMEEAQSAASGGEDPDEVVCTIGEPASLPEGVPMLSEEAAASLLLTRTSAVRAGHASFPEMVADAMAAHYSEVGCDAAVINGGFIRGDRAYALGSSLTLRDVRYELPFPKVAVLLRIRGDAIVQALGEMLAPHPNPSGSYPHVSAALHVDFDPAQPVGCKTKVTRVTLRGAPIVPDREYLLSITTFMASGGDGVVGWTRGTVVSHDQHKVAELVLKHMRRLRVLHPNLRPRVKAAAPRNNRG